MTNQLILWATLIVPWLTLFFMPKEDIKRWMPAALLSMTTSAIIHDMGIRLGFWFVLETAYPYSQLTPYLFGLVPALTIWVFNFTYRNFWVYMATNLILDIGFCYVFLGMILPRLGILTLGIPPYGVLLINMLHATLLYGYQIWQEGIFARSEKNERTEKAWHLRIQQPALKLQDIDQNEQGDNE